MSAPPAYDVVVPTVGRRSLARLLASLDACGAPAPTRILLADDRPPAMSDTLMVSGNSRMPLIERVELLRTGARGPAAARNAGWRAASAPWVAFLDDDVVLPRDWSARLAEDLAGAGASTAGVQGRIVVPLPADRRPTDWERNVAGLERARWATADLAYRRAALAQVGGFDERFTRNYREDADLGLRLVTAGWEIRRGGRTAIHPVGRAGRRVSLRVQAGNADDALMRRLHGPDWRTRAGAPPGRLPRHAMTAAAGASALALLAAGRRRAAALTGGLWLAGTAELAWARIAPGPRTADEVVTMLATSAAMPFAATGHRLRGAARWWGDRASREEPSRHGAARKEPSRERASREEPSSQEADRTGGTRTDVRAPQARVRPPAVTGPARSGARPARARPAGDGVHPQAVFLDRDGTLIADVPYNADPAKVRPMPGAARALALLRAAAIPTAVVSNQSGIGRGLLTRHEVDAIDARVEELLGPLGPWVLCPHVPADGCACRKPAPGLILEAAERLGVPPERCAVIGDIGADVEAARAAGARGVLVPTPLTRHEEVDAAAEVAPDLVAAVELLLGVVAPEAVVA